MFLLLSLASAAPAIDPALQRTCAQQKCGDRCIPWSETCPASVQRSLTEMQEADRQRQLNEALCGKAPKEPTEAKPATIEQQILLGTAVGMLFGAQSAQNPDACKQEGMYLPPPAEVPPSPACGERPPPTATAPAPSAPAPATPPR